MTIAAILEDKAARGADAVTSVPGDMGVADAVRLLAERRIGAVPVVEGDQVIGIFSERDLVYGLAQEGAAILDRSVREVMTAPAITVEPQAPILHALALMTRRRVRHLPVMQGGGMAGFVSIGDLVKRRIDQIEAEAAAMRDYIAS